MTTLPAHPSRPIPEVERHLLRCFDQATTYGVPLPSSWADPTERRRQIATYAEVLAPFSEEQVSRAWKAHLLHPKRGGWMPRVADLLRYLPRLATTPETPEPVDADAAAWDHLDAQRQLSPSDRSDAGVTPHQRRAWRRVTGGFRVLGGFGRDEANEARNWPFLRRRFLEICREPEVAETPAPPPRPPPSPEETAAILRRLADRDRAETARETAPDSAVAAPGASARAPAPRNQPGGAQRPRMSAEEVTQRTLAHAAFVARLEAERASFRACEGCLMPGGDDGDPSCAESGTCEREARASRVGAR